jgi:hypothetical protein
VALGGAGGGGNNGGADAGSAGLAGALQAALANRKKKVSGSGESLFPFFSLGLDLVWFCGVDY